MTCVSCTVESLWFPYKKIRIPLKCFIPSQLAKRHDTYSDVKCKELDSLRGPAMLTEVLPSVLVRSCKTVMLATNALSQVINRPFVTSCAKFVVKVVKISPLVFWVVTLRGLVGRCQWFRGTHPLHLQSWEAINDTGEGKLYSSYLFILSSLV